MRTSERFGFRYVIATMVLALVISACGGSSENLVGFDDTNDSSAATAVPTTAAPVPTAVPTAVVAGDPEDDSTSEDGPSDEGESTGGPDEGFSEPWQTSPLRDALLTGDELSTAIGATWELDYVDLLEAEPGSGDGPCGLAEPGQFPGIESQFFADSSATEFSQTVQYGEGVESWIDTISNLADCEGDFLGVAQIPIEVPGADRAVLVSSPDSADDQLAVISGAFADDVFVGLVVFAEERTNFPTQEIMIDMLTTALERATDLAN